MVTLSFGGSETVTVEADTEAEAITRAESGWSIHDVEIDVDDVQQIAGPPPTADEIYVVHLCLADGREIDLPPRIRNEPDAWFPVGNSGWWTEGHIAVRLLAPPTGHMLGTRLIDSIDNVLNGDTVPASLTSERKTSAREWNLRITAAKITSAAGDAWIDERYIPLIYSPLGTEIWCSATVPDLLPAFGKLNGEIVSVVMPVRL